MIAGGDQSISGICHLLRIGGLPSSWGRCVHFFCQKLFDMLKAAGKMLALSII